MQNFCTARKRMKFATKPMWHYPPHLRYVTTLPRETKNSNFLHLEEENAEIAFFIASNFLITYSFTNFEIFGVQNSESFSMLIVNKIFRQNWGRGCCCWSLLLPLERRMTTMYKRPLNSTQLNEHLWTQRRVSHFHFYENLVAANLGMRFALWQLRAATRNS